MDWLLFGFFFVLCMEKKATDFIYPGMTLVLPELYCCLVWHSAGSH